jgi:hypothetical protein
MKPLTSRVVLALGDSFGVNKQCARSTGGSILVGVKAPHNCAMNSSIFAKKTLGSDSPLLMRASAARRRGDCGVE